MMLVQYHAVESKLVGIDELLDIFLIEVTGAIAIPQRIRNGYPSAVVTRIEVGRQIRVGHEMPTEESDWMHAAAPPTVLIVCCNARRIPKGRQTSRDLRPNLPCNHGVGRGDGGGIDAEAFSSRYALDRHREGKDVYDLVESLAHHELAWCCS